MKKLSILIALVFAVLSPPSVALVDQHRLSDAAPELKTQTDGQADILYRNSYLLIIGNSQYQNPAWKSLPGVEEDIPAVQQAFEKHAFKVEVARNLPRNELLARVDQFISDYGQDYENRLVIYYAGHGYTARLGHDRKMGYLVMKDAPEMPPVLPGDVEGATPGLAKFRLRAVSMDEINEKAQAIASRHAIFIFDSCFSGTVLYRDNTVSTPKAITAEELKQMRGFLTAGNELQRVRDVSPFRRALVKGLDGEADLDRDGLILFTELGLYMRREVAAETGDDQTPLFGKAPKFDRGEMIFVLPQKLPRLYARTTNPPSKDSIIHTPQLAPLATSNPAVPNATAESPKLDLITASALLDRAIQAKDGSQQGQVGAIEELLRRGFVYKNSSFDGVSFAGAILNGADFSASKFVDGDLSNTSFKGGKLDTANLNFANLQNASIRDVSAKEALFQYTDAEAADFEGATLDRSSFFLSRLPRANFSNAKLRGVCLAFCDLTGADFTGADLTDAIIYSSVLDNAKFDDAIINNTDVGNSVANTILFTPAQRAELRRSAPLYREIDVKIWTRARVTGEFNAQYPEFASSYTKLAKIPQRMTGSLKFRNAETQKPVGVFQNYGRNERNEIDVDHWLHAEFWEQGNRAKRLKKRLESYGEFLFEQIGNQPLIEGSGVELKGWMSFIEKNSQVVAFVGPVIWTSDSYTTLLLAKGLITPQDLDEYDWRSLAVGRCRQDAVRGNGGRSDSWQPMYPPGAVCNLLPYQHVEAYRKWTIARSKNLNLQQLEVVYTFDLFDWGRVNTLAIDGKSSKEQILIFDNVKQTSDPLDSSMLVHNWRYEKLDFVLGLPTRELRMPFLKLPAPRPRFAISVSPGQAPTAQGGKSSDETYFQLRVFFDLLQITAKDKLEYEFEVVPRKARIEYAGKQIWEGPVVQRTE